MKLAVHDLLTKNEGETTQQVFERTKELVHALDKIGYHRYWFAEHHGSDIHVSSAPEILVSYFAGQTQNIQVGTGGTMIMHYSPLKVAETFKTLASLAPGRINLGLGRAPGGGPNEILALCEGHYVPQDDLYGKIETILNLIQDEKPREEIYQKTVAVPTQIDTLPEPWMLGSTGNSALRAAYLGLGYSFAKFFSIETPKEIFEMYRQEFQPSAFFDKPTVSVSYRVLVADTEEDVKRMEKTFEAMQVASYRNQFIAVPSDEEAQKMTFTDAEKARLQHDYDKRFIIKGTKDEVKKILLEEVETYGIDELMFYSPIYDPKDRLRNYELLYEMFNS